MLDKTALDPVGIRTPDIAFVMVNKQQLVTVLKKGASGSIPIEFKIKPGYHIIADHGSDRSLLYTKLFVQGVNGVQAGEARYASVQEFVPLGIHDKAGIFKDTLEISVPVNIAEDARSGIHLIRGSLYYQACDATKCYFPRELTFQLAIHVA